MYSSVAARCPVSAFLCGSTLVPSTTTTSRQHRDMTLDVKVILNLNINKKTAVQYLRRHHVGGAPLLMTSCRWCSTSHDIMSVVLHFSRHHDGGAPLLTTSCRWCSTSNGIMSVVHHFSRHHVGGAPLLTTS